MMGFSAHVLVAVLAAASPVGESSGKDAADFITQIQELYALISCAKDQLGAQSIDPGTLAVLCDQSAWAIERHRRVYDDQSRAFFSDLLPGDLPGTVVYPFAAADLTSALDTFFDADEIITLSEERAGDPRKIPAILASKQANAMLHPLAAAANGALLWSDSKTVSIGWAQRTGLPPSLLLFLVALAAHGDRPVSLKFFRIQRDGSMRYLKEGEAVDQGAFANSEITFESTDGLSHVHRHVFASLADWDLKRAPGVLAFLDKRSPYAAMTKSSNYRLWQPGFSILREHLLRHMAIMVSDSTGIPREFAKRAGFEQEGYGHFLRPIVEQNGRFVRELRDVFGRAIRKPLPFRFGYLDADRHYNLVITRSAKTSTRASPVRPLIEEDLHGGTHWRVWTKHDAVHVFRPAYYDPVTAGLLVFVHGYYVDVDRAWSDFALGEQFLDSKRNALFIVPETTIGDEEDIFWNDLSELTATVVEATKVKAPQGPVVLMAHSGGYRNVLTWLERSSIREVVLLDGAYGRLRDFKAWVEAVPDRQLILTSSSTADRARDFASRVPGAAEVAAVPEDAQEIARVAKTAPVVFIESQYEHMDMVRNRKVIPTMLKLLPIPELPY